MKRRTHTWINGTRGAISLLLACLLLPFFSLAAVLVEAGRYQSAVKSLDGALGSSTISTLAQYDGYLKDRFGLLAVSQDSDLTDTTASYLNRMQLTDLSAVSLSAVSAQGMYPLADPTILHRQILEYSKLVVPAKLVADGLSIDDLVKKLEKATKLVPIFNTLSSGCDVVSAEADVFEALEKAENAARKAETEISNYNRSFSKWQDSVTELIDHLNTSRPSGESEEGDAENWDLLEEELTDASEKARGAYLSAIKALISALDALQSKVDDAVSALAKLDSSQVSFATTAMDSAFTLENTDPTASDAAKKQAEEQIKTHSAIQSSLSSGAKDISSRMEECLKSFDSQRLLDASAQLQRDRAAVEDYSTQDIGPDSSAPAADSYHTADVDGLADADTLSQLLNSTVDDLNKNGLLDFISSMLTIANTLFKTKTLFDPALNSKLDVAFYNDNYGGLPSYKDRGDPAHALSSGNAADQQRSMNYLAAIDPDFDPDNPYGMNSSFDTSMIARIMTDLEQAMTSAQTIKDTFGEAAKLLDFFKALGKFAQSLVALIADTCLFITQIAVRVAQLLGAAAYDRLLLNGYLAYNLPNRTTYNSAGQMTLTGYSFSKIPYGDIPAEELYQIPGSELIALVQAISHGGGYPNKTFTGAELEYVLWGLNSEIGNQAMQFVTIYLLRLILDLPVLMADQEVETYISMAGPLSPLVAAIYLFCEPFADTLILVNRGKVPLVKGTPYLTIQGLPKLIGEFTSLPMTDDMSAKIQSEAAKLGGVAPAAATGPSSGASIDLSKGGDEEAGKKEEGSKDSNKDYFSLNYTEYSLLLLMVAGSESLCLNRLTDLIQAESSAYRDKNQTLSQRASGTLKDFNIDEGYTVIRSSAQGSLVQLLPVPSLSASSTFGIDRVIYRGY